MIGGLYNGMSGVNTYMSGLNVTTNNISNVNTIGHRADNVSFEDLMYQNGSYGKGSAVASVEKNFNQGSIQGTDNPYDFAINGKGFLVVQDPLTDANYYTRAGNFTESKFGELQDNNGFNVMGVQSQKTSTDGTVDTEFDGTYSEFLASKIIYTEDEVISTNAKSTNYLLSAEDVSIASGTIKTSTAIISDIDALKTNYNNSLNSYASDPTQDSIAPTNQSIDLTFANYADDLTSADNFVGLDINGFVFKENFSIDAATTMRNMAEKITNSINGLDATFNETTGVISIANLIPGNNAVVNYTQDSFSVPTIDTVSAIEGSGLADIEAARTALKEQVELANGNFLSIDTSIPSKNQTELSLETLNLQLSNLGISDNDDIAFSVVDDGILLLNQGGNSYIAGRVSSAYFADQSGLNPIGDNLYEATIQSGEPKNADALNTIVSNSIELSNVSLAEGLQNLIIHQRAFEANAKSITTSDEFLKTAIALKNS